MQMTGIKEKFLKDRVLVQIPKKGKMRLRLFDELIRKFDGQNEYSEKEVNAVLKGIYSDHVTLRRYLVDYRYLLRTDDGSCYKVNNKVTLKFYDPVHYRDLEQYVLTNEDAFFSAKPLDALASCKNNPDRQLVLIIQRRRVAGVFILQSGNIVKGYSDNPCSLVMFSYSVDSTKQGHGVATASFRALDAFVAAHYQDVDEVALGVNIRNDVARHVYRKAGFTDTGRSFEGPVGWQNIMSKTIER